MSGRWQRALSLALLLGSAPVFASDKEGRADYDSPKGFASPGAFSADAFMGSASYSVPIEVPPFRGREPSIALRYNSQGANGLAGVGWSIAISEIQKKPRTATGYYLDGQLLQPCTSFGGNYCTRSPSYRRINRNVDGSWTVTGRDGTRATYESAGVERWALVRVVDTNGNQVNYNWNGRRPTTITYGTNYAEISFEWENRTDGWSMATGSGLETISERLKAIRVRVGGQLVRKYALGYVQSPKSGKSLLKTVRQFGRNGDEPGAVSLPPVTFTYSSEDVNAPKESFIDGWSITSSDANKILTVGDWNGDGKSTVYEVVPNSGWEWMVWDRDGDGDDDRLEVQLQAVCPVPGEVDVPALLDKADSTPENSVDDVLELEHVCDQPFDNFTPIRGDFNGDGVDELRWKTTGVWHDWGGDRRIQWRWEDRLLRDRNGQSAHHEVGYGFSFQR